MKNILIGAGHINVKHNSIVALRSSTGAPGEQEFTLRIASRLSEILRQKGFNVKQTDANANDDATVTKPDWDLALFCHYDANIYGTGGGFADFPEPSTDGATVESQRIVKALEDEYFKHSGIVNVPKRRNANTKYYYMWSRLSSKTPCAILECGVGLDAHDKVILADTDIVCNAIARGICKAFNVPFDAPTPPQIDPKDEKIKNLEKKILELEKGISSRDEEVIGIVSKTEGLLNQAKEEVLKLKK